ncbi:MAG: hypothetical protein LC804_26420, partial [Acidobacteria bacterium]|nr:hypothetical protein [Acidobacteriota bacterium]
GKTESVVLTISHINTLTPDVDLRIALVAFDRRHREPATARVTRAARSSFRGSSADPRTSFSPILRQ